MKPAEKPIVPPKGAIAFTRRLGAVLRFAVPLRDAIEIASGEVKHSRLRQAIHRVKRAVAEGTPFSKALSTESRFFPPFYIAAVARGEKTGNLPSSLKELAEDLDALAAARGLVRRGSRYPFMTALAVLIIISVGVFFLFPTVLTPARYFKEALDRFDTTLPATGWGFFWVAGTFLADHAVGIVLIACGLLALISLDALFLRSSPRGRLIVERRKLRLPLYGRSMRNVNLSIFCDTIGRHLEYGSSLSEALTAAQKAVPSAVFREEVSKLGRELQAGSTLSEAIKRSKWFPFALIRAVAAGESRGQLAETLVKMANSYYEESDYGVQRMSRWARAWVGSLAVALGLFCVGTFLCTIATFLLPLRHG